MGEGDDVESGVGPQGIGLPGARLAGVCHRIVAGNGLGIFRLQVEALQVEEAVEAEEQFLATFTDDGLDHLRLRGRRGDGRIITAEALGPQLVDIIGGLLEIVQAGI